MKKYGSLKEVLEAFQGANGKEETLAEQFRELAEYLFYGGYLEVNGKRRVYLRDLEFYYHEEEGTVKVKDLIMYHRDTQSGDKKAYFPLGMLHAHQSGIDITFESEDGKYRAAVLVRGYNAVEAGEVLGKKYDAHSTHLYDALFTSFPLTEGIQLKWVHAPMEAGKGECIVQTVRRNVAEYDMQENKVGVKREDVRMVDGIPFDKAGRQVTENKKYVQDMRKWRYIRKI